VPQIRWAGVGAAGPLALSPHAGGRVDARPVGTLRRSSRPTSQGARHEDGPRSRHDLTRLAAGAFILNSGLSKRGADADTAKGLHGMASTAYPALADMEPQQFTKLLSTAEIALGVALLLPVVPTALAGAGLTAFEAGLVG
jgi:hypothetical protein